MAETRTDLEHEFGHIRTYKADSGDVLVLDAYEDQYSLTWSTDLDPASFLSIWAQAGAEKSRSLIHLAGSKEPLEGYGYQLFEMVRQGPRQVNEAKIALIRLWMRDVSVTWQVFPKSQAVTCPVVGIASDHIDPEAIIDYFEATATPSIQKTGRHIPKLLSDLIVTFGPIPTLRFAAEAARYNKRLG